MLVKKRGAFEKEAWVNLLMLLWPFVVTAIIIVFFAVKRILQ
jgi:hypothetical protein